MAGFDGALVLVQVDMNPGGAADWQVVAAQQSFSYETSRNMLDGSVKGTDHSESAYGRHESTATVEGLVAIADGTQARLEEAMVNRELVNLRYVIEASPATGLGTDEVYEAPALVASVSRTFPDNENSTFSVEFNLNEYFQLIP
jgi:TP901-1 family phage major tail protein